MNRREQTTIIARMAKTRATAKAPVPRVAPPSSEGPPAEKTAGAPEKAGPRSLKAARTRVRLIAAAKEIFEEHGFLEARISDISERAGQSHGSFYYYFQSKEEVFREVAATIDDALFAPLDDVILAQSQLEPPQRIREAVRRHFESYRREAKILGLIEHVARFDPEVNALRLRRHQQHTERVARTIRGMQRRKVADSKLDPMIAAAALGALTERFLELWLVHGAIDVTLEAAVEQLTRLYMNALNLKHE
jgi:AcrR family transcriptional regulator